jgi:glucose-6-phosphate 1-epimerase
MPGNAVRGGVPVLFPQFANKGSLPKHGFARNLIWQEQSAWHSTSEGGVVYELDVSDHAVVNWPHKATLKLEIFADPNQLFMKLLVANTGINVLEWTGGLHPYWWVPNLLDAEIVGLKLNIGDKTALGVNGFERIFPNRNPVTLVRSGTSALKIKATGFDEWMVWNPGQEAAELLVDMPVDDWQYFVCIEPVCITNPVKLNPGQSFEGILHAQLIEL